MPFKSEKQRRYLYANEPEIAKKWSKKYGNKILKAKGGADASKADFNTPGTTASAPPSMGFGNPPPSSRTNNNTNNNNTTTPNKTIGKIPVIGPLTAGLRLIQNLTTPKQKANPLSANTIKQTKQQIAPPVGGGGDNRVQLCPDGTYPPCKTPQSQSLYNGGEVVISSNVDKDLL